MTKYTRVWRSSVASEDTRDDLPPELRELIDAGVNLGHTLLRRLSDAGVKGLDTASRAAAARWCEAIDQVEKAARVEGWGAAGSQSVAPRAACAEVDDEDNRRPPGGRIARREP